MKHLIVLIYIVFFFTPIFSQASDLKLSRMKKLVREQIKIVLDTHAKTLVDKYSSSIYKKDISGAQFTLKNAIIAKYYKCTGSNVNRNRACQNINEEQIPIAEFKEQIQNHLKQINSKHFKFNLKRPLVSKIKSWKVIIGNVGLFKGSSVRFASNLNYRWGKKTLDDTHFYLLNITTHLEVLASVPTKEIEIKNVKIEMNGRKSSGEIHYERLGPGISQINFKESISFKESESFEPLKSIIAGDYKVTAKGLFCGCDKVLESEKVFDSSLASERSDHKFVLPSMVRAFVRGRLLDDQERETPIINAEIGLKPACSDSDECMGDVKVVQTDAEGKFEFVDVPKGVYELVYRNKSIGKVTNCNFKKVDVEVGDFKIAMPHYYDIDVKFNSTDPSAIIKRSHVKFKWVALRSVDKKNPPQEFSDSFIGDVPFARNGYPLKVPYQLISSDSKAIFWGESRCSEDGSPLFFRLRKNLSNTYGLRCSFDKDDLSFNDLFFNYNASSSIEKNSTHHLGLQISTTCRGSGDKVIEIAIGNMGNSSVDSSVDPHQFEYSEIDEVMLRSIKNAETFTKVITNEIGSTLSMTFTYMGIEFVANDCSNPRSLSAEERSSLSEDDGYLEDSYSFEEEDDGERLSDGEISTPNKEEESSLIEQIISAIIDAIVNIF